MDITEEFDISLVCRLCTSNILEFPECYSIDEPIEELINTLLTIKFDHITDKSNLRLCINCYDCMNTFNEFRQNALDTHQKLKKLDLSLEDGDEIDQNSLNNYEIEELTEENELEEEEGIIEYINTDEAELAIDTIEDEDELVEATQKEEPNEIEYAVENILGEIDDGDLINNKVEAKNFVKKSETSSEGREKGKEIYQKLLQKCHICGKQIEKNRLEGHINKHNNIRPFKCNECEKTFYCKQLLRLHKSSIHTNIKVKCDQCDKFFPSARALYAHTLRHKNQDRYVCEMCEKKFNNSNSLKRHMAIHSGVREFVCTICGVGFYRKFNLDVHIKNVHHQTKEFACNIDACKKSFGYARLLKDHIKKCHPRHKVYEVSVEY
ncbi:hypothetical protein PVAND_013983 [Polypedilum vanderplanki]|uniref:Zinc finger protein n=1 Tax=Polypedilum vanderplanki TaxID=319348 RepID=A0A9J6CR05_POLVA|nr:hypothetical protein PVAND_013983 [Polypedilum vanderplanki]